MPDSVVVFGVRFALVHNGYTYSVHCVEISKVRKIRPTDRNYGILFDSGVCRVQTQILPYVCRLHFVSVCNYIHGVSRKCIQ